MSLINNPLIGKEEVIIIWTNPEELRELADELERRQKLIKLGDTVAQIVLQTEEVTIKIRYSN